MRIVTLEEHFSLPVVDGFGGPPPKPRRGQ